MKKLLGGIALAVLLSSVPALAQTQTRPAVGIEQNEVVKKKKPVKKKKNAKKQQKKPITVVIPPPPPPKCYFLFWEVDCNLFSTDPQVTNQPKASSVRSKKIEVTNVRIADSKKNIEKANQYVGLNARRNRKELQEILSKEADTKIDPVHIPWCAAFANYILARNGYAHTDSLLARSYLGYGFDTKKPEPGDIVVLKRGREQWAGHVGFYVGEIEEEGVKYVAVLGGNQQKGVNISYYEKRKVLGYRKPVAIS